MARFDNRNDDDRVIAIGLLTHREVSMFGAQLSRLYPLDEDCAFADLIEAIDEADRDAHRKENVRGG